MRSLTQNDPATLKAAAEPAGLTRLLFRSKLWLHARLMPLQLIGRSLKQTLDLTKPRAAKGRFSGFSSVYIVQAVRRATRHPWVMRDRRCLREGLLAYRFLAEAGFRPRLHFGVKSDIAISARVAAHCWVSLDGRTVIGESEIPYVEILQHPLDDVV